MRQFRLAHFVSFGASKQLLLNQAKIVFSYVWTGDIQHPSIVKGWIVCRTRLILE